MSSNPAHDEAYSIQHYVIKFVSDLCQVGVSPGNLVSSTNKTDHQYIRILLKVKHHNPSPIIKCFVITVICSSHTFVYVIFSFFSVYQHPIQPSCLHVHEESVYFSTSTEVCIVNLASDLITKHVWDEDELVSVKSNDLKIFVTISYLSIVRVWDTDNIAADEVEETEDDYG